MAWDLTSVHTLIDFPVKCAKNNRTKEKTMSLMEINLTDYTAAGLLSHNYRQAFLAIIIILYILCMHDSQTCHNIH